MNEPTIDRIDSYCIIFYFYAHKLEEKEFETGIIGKSHSPNQTQKSITMNRHIALWPFLTRVWTVDYGAYLY